jgi:hypothetical protein
MLAQYETNLDKFLKLNKMSALDKLKSLQASKSSYSNIQSTTAASIYGRKPPVHARNSSAHPSDKKSKLPLKQKEKVNSPPNFTQNDSAKN